MMRAKASLLLFAFLVGFIYCNPNQHDKRAVSSSPNYVRVCYFTNWSQYRKGAGKFVANDIDPHLCTHIMHSFAKIKGGVIATTEWNDAKILRDLTNLKRKNPKLKILVAIGGWTFGVKLFTEIGSTRKHRAVFIESAIRFVRRHRLDGIDLDWEYPAHRKSPATDKQKFTLLCQELREAIDQEKLTSGRNRLLLTAAVGASKSIAHTAYEISEISQSLDFINLLTYDFYGYYNGETGHHAALVGTLEQPNSVQAAVEYWISQGAPTNKLVLGLGTYGRTYTLSHAVDNGLKASVSGAGNPGKYTKEKGVLAYYEICSLDDLTVIEAKDSPVQASYGYVGTQWIAFDNTASMLLKVDFAKDQGLRGVMFWTLDLDDFKGKFCKAGKYPLMNAVKKRLESSEPPLTSVKPSPLKIQHTAPKKKQQPLIVQRPKAPTKQILQPLGMKNKSEKSTSKYIRACYFTNWSQYRKGDGKFVPSDIDPYLCTHIMHSFAKIKGGVIATTEWNDNKILSGLTRLKQKNPNLKILVAIGGWTFGVKLFSEMASTRKHREVFIKSVIRFVRKHDLDGVDLDWEYPAHRKTPATDMQKFTLLCKELKEAIDTERLSAGRNRLLFTAAVGASQSIAQKAYDIFEISRYLDFINLLSYDFYGYYNGETGHHAALVGTVDQPNSVRAAVEYWVGQGAPRNKLVLGLGTYGRTYTLSHAVEHGLKAPASGAGEPGKYTKEKGFLAYYEICTLDMKVVEAKDSPVRSSYGYLGTQWIAFDNPASMQLKVDYAKAESLGGVMFWTLDLDDFSGKFCNAGKYPLMNSVKKRLESSEPSAAVNLALPPLHQRPQIQPQPQPQPHLRRPPQERPQPKPQPQPQLRRPPQERPQPKPQPHPWQPLQERPRPQPQPKPQPKPWRPPQERPQRRPKPWQPPQERPRPQPKPQPQPWRPPQERPRPQPKPQPQPRRPPQERPRPQPLGPPQQRQRPRPPPCRAIGMWEGDAREDGWCNFHCPRGYCPEYRCYCDWPW